MLGGPWSNNKKLHELFHDLIKKIYSHAQHENILRQGVGIYPNFTKCGKRKPTDSDSIKLRVCQRESSHYNHPVVMLISNGLCVDTELIN